MRRVCSREPSGFPPSPGVAPGKTRLTGSGDWMGVSRGPGSNFHDHSAFSMSSGEHSPPSPWPPESHSPYRLPFPSQVPTPTNYHSKLPGLGLLYIKGKAFIGKRKKKKKQTTTVYFSVMASLWGRTKRGTGNHIPLGQEAQAVHYPLSRPIWDTWGWGWRDERE